MLKKLLFVFAVLGLGNIGYSGEISIAFVDGAEVSGDLIDPKGFVAQENRFSFHPSSDGSKEVFNEVISVLKDSFRGLAEANLTDFDTGRTFKVYFYLITLNDERVGLATTLNGTNHITWVQNDSE